MHVRGTKGAQEVHVRGTRGARNTKFSNFRIRVIINITFQTLPQF